MSAPGLFWEFQAVLMAEVQGRTGHQLLDSEVVQRSFDFADSGFLFFRPQTCLRVSHDWCGGGGGGGGVGCVCLWGMVGVGGVGLLPTSFFPVKIQAEKKPSGLNKEPSDPHKQAFSLSHSRPPILPHC